MQLARALGLPSLVFYGVGIILGAGIYSVLGVASRHAGEALWMSFAVSGALALLTALAYAELAAMYPEASAEFTYLRRALPRAPSVATATGLLVALSGTATAGTVAIAFAGYLDSFVEVPMALAAWAVLAVAAGLNVVGVKESSVANAIFTLIEAGGLVVLIALGMSSDSFGRALAAAPNAGVTSGAALVFFSFLGFENIANLAEEAEHPERDVPRAIFISLAIATVLYVLVALAAVALLPVEQLAGAEAPLADAARQKSPRLAGALGGIALFATANTALVSMLVSSRVIFGMAREKQLPPVLAAVLPKRRTPWVATLLTAIVASALVPFGEVAIVSSLSSFAALVAFAAVNVALIVLRYRKPEEKRPFRVPATLGRLPVLPALGVLATLAVATQLERVALASGGIALACFAAYALWWQRRPRTRRRASR